MQKLLILFSNDEIISSASGRILTGEAAVTQLSELCLPSLCTTQRVVLHLLCQYLLNGYHPDAELIVLSLLRVCKSDNMSHFCPYCSQLIKADKAHNYCSNVGDNILTAKTNAFYLQNKQLQSGQHIARLSVRAVLNGYHYYKTGGNDRVVKKDNYLIVNQGQTWESAIESETPVEAIVIAFHPDFLTAATDSLTTKTAVLLDNPFNSTTKEVNFFENTYPNDPQTQQLFLQFKKHILEGSKEEMIFEQLYFDLFKNIFETHHTVGNQSLLIPSKKVAVKKELFQRLGIAKDYMMAHLGEKLTVANISSVAALSPYHFIRLFKAVYQLSPHQFLTQERMKLAHYLLQSSTKTIQEICYDVGFDNHSAFGRVFKKQFGITPRELR